MLSFNQLRALVALDHHRNFHRAARSIDITQPALSLSIRNIEESIGNTLFDRSHRSVETTEAGRLVVEHAKEILAKFGNLESALDEYNGLEEGEVGFGVGPYIVRKRFPAVIKSFCRRFPAIKPRFQVAAYDTLHQSLIDDEISLYIADCTLAMDSDKFSVTPLWNEQIELVARPDHPLAQKPEVRANDIIRYPFVAVSGRISSDLKAWFVRHLKSPEERALMQQNHPYIVCDYYEATRALVLATDYLTGGPSDLVGKDIERGTLVRLPLKSFRASLATGIVTRRDRTLSPAARALKECFEQVYTRSVAA